MVEHRVLAVSGSDHSFEGQLPKLQKLRKYFGKILWEAMQIRVEGVQACPLGFNTMYTDGVKERFELKDYPQLRFQKAEKVATTVTEKFGKHHDDAGCIVMRQVR